MLNTGKKIRAPPDIINKYSNSRVVRKKYSERNQKPQPPLHVKWSVLYILYINKNVDIKFSVHDA